MQIESLLWDDVRPSRGRGLNMCTTICMYVCVICVYMFNM